MSFPPPTPFQARVLWAAATALGLAVIAVVIAGLIWGTGQLLSLLAPIVWPLAVAGALAYLLDPAVDLLVKRRVPRARAILCVFAIAAMLISALGARLLPQVIVESKNLVENLPRYATGLQHRVEKMILEPPAWLRSVLRPESKATQLPAPATSSPTNETGLVAEAVVDGPETAAKTWYEGVVDAKALRSATEWLTSVMPQLGSWVFGQVTRVASWLGLLAGLALVPIYLFYFLLEKEGIQKSWTEYLPVARSDFKDELVFVLRSINDYLIVFFRSQVLVAICDGALYAIGFALIGLQYSLLLGVGAVALTMIPFIGAMTTCALALLIAIVQFGDFLHPLLVLAVVGVVQAIEGLVLSPKIMGDRVGLHPLTIIIAVVAGTSLLGGVLGGILAIPFTAVLRVLMFRYVWKGPTVAVEPAKSTRPASAEPHADS